MEGFWEDKDSGSERVAARRLNGAESPTATRRLSDARVHVRALKPEAVVTLVTSLRESRLGEFVAFLPLLFPIGSARVLDQAFSPVRIHQPWSRP